MLLKNFPDTSTKVELRRIDAMKSKNSRLLREILSIIVFAAVCFGIYEGASFLRGLSVNRVYGKDTRKQILHMAQDQDWEQAAETIKNKGQHNLSNAPERLEPYLVILIPKWDRPRDSQLWKVLACSEKDPGSLDGIQTVVFCKYTEETAGYGQPGASTSSSTGTSEFVHISYVNAQTGLPYKWEYYGKDLPGKSSGTPHFKVSTNKLLSHIKKALQDLGKQP
jgi:hypothetical protein